MLGTYENADRRIKQPGLEPVDVLMLTLDAEVYLEKCLDSLYREVPVNKVIVVDGGSKDKTVAILSGYPRTEVHIRPDIRTTGKCLEFAFVRVATPWVVFLDADVELAPGWYDEMVKHRETYDFFGCKRIQHWEFWQLNAGSIDVNYRPLGAPWLAKLECFKGFHVDDDYMWGVTDFMLRQVAEKNGYRFGKVATTYHYHHTTDNMLYQSDPEKRGRRMVFEPPKWEIIDTANWERAWENYRRAIVKYLEPEFVFPSEGRAVLYHLRRLDMEWVRNTSPEWYDILSRYRRQYPALRAKAIALRIPAALRRRGIAGTVRYVKDCLAGF